MCAFVGARNQGARNDVFSFFTAVDGGPYHSLYETALIGHMRSFEMLQLQERAARCVCGMALCA